MRSIEGSALSATERGGTSGQIPSVSKLWGASQQSSTSSELLLKAPLPDNPSAIMLVKGLRCSRALPVRRKAFIHCIKRTVTTDAASSHAEKEHVPEVRTKIAE